MRDQEDQMDHGSAGAMRGQSHVRIPQRRINRSLRSGVTPSMQQPTAGNGQFQGSPIISNRVMPRQMPTNRGRMFHEFMQRARPQRPPMERMQGMRGGNGATDSRMIGPNGGMRFPHPGGNPIRAIGQGTSWGVGSPIWEKLNGERPPVFGHPMPPERPPVGGRPPIGLPPVTDQGGGPILGHGQTMNAMIQAIMGDLGQGINPAQFANMQAGTLPGNEHGDFLRALGGGDMNNNPLQALVAHLIQGAPGANGAPGNYMINGDQGGAIAQILRQAIQNNPNFNPPRPPRPRPQFPMPGRTPGLPNTLFPLNPGALGGIPQAGLPR